MIQTELGTILAPLIVGTLSVAVSADDITFSEFIFQAFPRLVTIDVGHRIKFGAVFSMIEIHHIGWVSFTAVSTRNCFSANKEFFDSSALFEALLAKLLFVRLIIKSFGCFIIRFFDSLLRIELSDRHEVSRLKATRFASRLPSVAAKLLMQSL
jgi:hypothetical protein